MIRQNRLRRRGLGVTVFDAALDRFVEMYEEADGASQVVVSFSAGKDSGVCLELAIMAATMTDRLPVHVMMRDEEIMLPGTYEYAERVAERPEVDMRWVYANQPIINVFNRREPYWWVFDPLLDPEEWVRQPPSFATRHPHLSIESLVTTDHYPVGEGGKLYDVIGLRVDESTRRAMSIHSAGGWRTKTKRNGVTNVRPIFDWTDRDVWRAIGENRWDYNRAYDSLARLGVPRKKLRIAPPTMSAYSLDVLSVASRAWPRWWSRVCTRIPGMRTAAQFGKAAVEPVRRLNETWEQAFHRLCIDEAPEWIAERATAVRDAYLRSHRRHSTAPFPESHGCQMCTGGRDVASWRKLTLNLYGGDPFCMKFSAGFGGLQAVEPEFFRPGSGTWGGKAQW